MNQLTERAAPNLEFLERLYADYRKDSASVSPEWRRYFDLTSNGSAPLRLGPSFRPASIFNPVGPPAAPARLQNVVEQLAHNYRAFGHAIARLDPLGRPRPCPPELDPASSNLTEADLDQRVSLEPLGGGQPQTVRTLLQRLRDTYCGSIGAQFMHVNDSRARQWLQEHMERSQNRLALSRDGQLRILACLIDAVTFEEFIRKKFIGAKSFSLEGSEGLIPLLDMAVEKAGAQDAREIVLAMAHRGRLNVLANIVGKSLRRIFQEFRGVPDLDDAPGDVKYHLGSSGDWKTADGHPVHLSLCFNPSHLEFVNPVALGRVRAKQDRAGDSERRQCLALLIHGDAALAGEGIIAETLNLIDLSGYKVGGALHIVLNNQIGYTTSPEDGRSTQYATDIALGFQVPIFHVNGEDPEAVAQVVHLAMDYRSEFQRDVVIDIYGYRRFGHNETDEPTFTHPVLYRAIKQRQNVRDAYLEQLIARGAVTAEEAESLAASRLAYLENEFANAGGDSPKAAGKTAPGVWSEFSGGPEANAPESDTGVDYNQLSGLLEKQTHFPADFHPHPKIQKSMETRREMAACKKPLDWSAAEALAFASLATGGVRIRLSGQDSARGTFSQRHGILYDFEDGHPFVPLQHLSDKQAPVEIFNSPLSEAAVLGFDYGYSLDYPEALVLWEAQFGDFVNAAQVIIDQFLTSAEEKWRRLSGLVLLLPHAFEGMGPEHSSARLERFLTVAAGDNIQIVQPTTPAQYFHCLRRQALRHWRKPLVVMTPKGLLRHPLVISKLEEFAAGRFQRVLPPATDIKSATRAILCSGKIFYELDAHRQKIKDNTTAILRLEQLYPFPEEPLQAALQGLPDAAPVIWAQEEPVNMGAWRYLCERIGSRLFGRFAFSVVSRPESASPATGSAAAHKQQQQRLIEQAFQTSEQRQTK